VRHESEEPTCRKFRIEIEAPLRQRALKIETLEPIRMKFLNDSDDPSDRKSSTVSDDPMRTQPYTDSDEPMRPKFLTLKAEPVHTASSAESEELRRAQPYKLKEDPKRPSERRESALPRLR
jgi:hypothetical protein